MMNRLIFKLLAINLVVIGFVMSVMWIAVNMLAAGYFVTLMEKYHISPEPAHDMFVSSVHRYLIWASMAALILAVLLSFIMMRRVLAPLSRMTRTTRDIAAGDFSSRVPEVTQDEVGQLAHAFNRMATSLEKLETLRRNLMIDVAHELRTPLTNIRGYLEALDDEVVPPSAETFDLLQQESRRLAQLVEDVLQMARADAAHGHLAIGPVDMAALVHGVLEPFAGRFKEKGVDVTVNVADGLDPVRADHNRMVRVLRNLTDNAARYTPERGRLEIEIAAAQGGLRVAFRNDVETVDPEDLPYLFERFYRSEKSRSREHGGAGIGLAIVKELVKAHGGRVGAELKEGGIEIWFTLPLDPRSHTLQTD
jgi:two-component system sensor histidine kinase BaeS